MKKWLLRIGLGVVGLVMLIYGFIFLRSIMPTTVNDRELKLERANIPTGSNAFEVLQSAANHMWWPENQGVQIQDLARDTNWDGNLANMVLAKNREALTEWDAAAKMPDLQVPEIITGVQSLPYLAKWKELAQLAAVRENFLLHNGQDKEAFNQIVNHILLGRRMQNAQAVFIGYLVGTAVNTMGLNQMNRWVGKTHLSVRELKGYIRKLDFDSADDGAALANSLRAEYWADVGSLAALRDGKVIDSDTGKYFPHPTPFWPAYSFSQTKGLFANAFRLLVKTSPLHYSEVEAELKRNASQLPNYEHRPGPISIILSGNAAGQIVFYLMMPAMAKAQEKKSQANVQLQATRTILALRAYQLTHGRLPENLTALVPEFLDAVPIDDFDGQPLRYSAEKKIVYSVGKNLKDDGGDDCGSDAPDAQRHLDLGFKFDF